MRIVSRKVISPHSKEEVLQILKNASYRLRPIKIMDDRFQIAFPFNWWHRQLGLIPVKGTVKEQAGVCEVQLEIHVSFSFYVAMVFLLSGILFYMCNLSFYSALTVLGVGIVIFVINLFNGITCLDSLEHRLTRKSDI